MQDLRFSIIQSPLHWEDRDTNRTQFSRLLDSIEACDVVILPEMFTTGFTMNVEPMSELMSGPTVNWMKNEAKRVSAVIGGSVIIKDNDRFLNRFIWAQPDGQIDHRLYL